MTESHYDVLDHHLYEIIQESHQLRHDLSKGAALVIFQRDGEPSIKERLELIIGYAEHVRKALAEQFGQSAKPAE